MHNSFAVQLTLHWVCHLAFYSTTTMASENQYMHAEKYESSEVKQYAQKAENDPENLAFLFPAADEYIKSNIPGKTVLDIACGKGIWSYKAAQYGAKSVHGFDIHEEMVQLAKQTISQFSTVNIRVGDVMNMPYDDNTFDVAVGLYVTCVLRAEVCIKLFKEIHRVLVPGGKAIVNCFSKPALGKLVVRSGADKELVETEIAHKLLNLASYSSADEINSALQDLSDLVHVFFTLDKSGHLQRITDVDKLTNEQAVWSKCRSMAFPNYYYDEKFFNQQIKAAGLKLDKIDNYYAEERRIAYNSANPEVKLDESITDTPTFFMYHLSKPTD